jgi:hypothetical protein
MPINFLHIPPLETTLIFSSNSYVNITIFHAGEKTAHVRKDFQTVIN